MLFYVHIKDLDVRVDFGVEGTLAVEIEIFGRTSFINRNVRDTVPPVQISAHSDLRPANMISFRHMNEKSTFSLIISNKLTLTELKSNFFFGP